MKWEGAGRLCTGVRTLAVRRPAVEPLARPHGPQHAAVFEMKRERPQHTFGGAAHEGIGGTDARA